MLEATRLRQLLLEAFPDAEVDLADLTGTQDHYRLHMASDRFVGLGSVGRHRLVYAALGEHMKGDVHALALVTYTKAEWQKRGGSA
jgi:stress-induced morphogen